MKHQLSPRERRAYEIILSRRKGVTVEEIAEDLFSGAERPTHWRGSLLVTLRRLTLKSLLLPHVVRRESEVGRGNVATYCAFPNPWIDERTKT